MNDEQADDEQADADEDLEAAFLCLEGDLTGGGEQEFVMPAGFGPEASRQRNVPRNVPR